VKETSVKGHHIATQNWQRKSAPKVAYAQNKSNHMSHNVLSTLFKADPKRWTKEEDSVLAMAIERQNGQANNWNLIACKARWWKKVGIGILESLILRVIVPTLSLALFCASDLYSR
jgi:hypothetical protein